METKVPRKFCGTDFAIRNRIRSECEDQGGGGSSSNSISDDLNLASTSIRSSMLALYDELTAILKPLTTSDRTCFRNLITWYIRNVQKGEFQRSAWGLIIDIAREALTERREKKIRNANAYFISRLKKELDYPN